MAIPDPHAIPETSESCTEYLHEADTSYDSGDSDHAYDLYHSVRNSHLATEQQRDHACLRLGLIAQVRGHIDEAVNYLQASSDPAAVEALHALTNATTHDRTPSADQVPATAEELYAWIDAGNTAATAGDFQTALGLYQACSQSAQINTGQLGSVYKSCGVSLEHLGQSAEARTSYEQALSLLSSADDIALVRERIHALGGGEATATDQSPAAAQVAAGVIAYENGDATAAQTAFQASLHLEGPESEKGRAHYYLAAMDYQAHHYAEARNHVEAAVATAASPEQGWAASMLNWRWDEHPAAAAGTGAAAGAPGAAAPGAPYSPTEI